MFAAARVIRQILALWTMALLAFGSAGCSQEEAARPESAARKGTGELTATPTATAAATPTPEPTPGQAIAFENFPLDAAKTMEFRGYATVEWPGHKDWAYLSVNGRMLTMAAHGPESRRQTELRLMLQPALYRLSAKGNLRETSQFPVVLTGSLSGVDAPLFQLTFEAGKPQPVEQTFTIEGEAREFKLELRLAPGAENRHGDHGAYGAALFLGEFLLEKAS